MLVRPRAPGGVVGRAVGAEHNLEAIAGIVERKEVFESRLDPLGLVIGHDDETYRRFVPG